MPIEQWNTSPPLDEDEERTSFLHLDPPTFHIRHPPPPHSLHTPLTPDALLFQTLHLGAAVLFPPTYRLSITGLVNTPFSLTLPQLQSLPSKTPTAFHECYGSPLVPPTHALRRIGNVSWTGVSLATLLSHAGVRAEARYIWADGLDRGRFAGVDADRYQKDLPLSKAWGGEVLVAWAMNGEPLGRLRGGPVRLVVPGWFGTNAVKWLCKVDVREGRAPGVFTTRFYNQRDPEGGGGWRPVWGVQPNSMVTRPVPEEVVRGGGGERVVVEGWAWSEDGVVGVEVCVDEGQSRVQAEVEARTGYSWQRFRAKLEVEPGEYVILARATGADGRTQPLGEGRNHVHRVPITVV